MLVFHMIPIPPKHRFSDLPSFVSNRLRVAQAVVSFGSNSDYWGQFTPPLDKLVIRTNRYFASSITSQILQVFSVQFVQVVQLCISAVHSG